LRGLSGIGAEKGNLTVFVSFVQWGEWLKLHLIQLPVKLVSNEGKEVASGKRRDGCVHLDNGPLGAKAYDRAEYRRVKCGIGKRFF
jgi:hypothetical protein